MKPGKLRRAAAAAAAAVLPAALLAVLCCFMVCFAGTGGGQAEAGAGATGATGATGDAGAQNRPVIMGADDPYTAAFISENSDYALQRNMSSVFVNKFDVIERSYFSNAFSNIGKNNLLECLDVQAEPAKDAGIAENFRPDCISTVIIAVDRDLTDFRPTGWNDLRNTDCKINMPDSNRDTRIIFAAIAYGLEGKNFGKNKVLSYLEELYSNDIVKLNNTKAPINICFDYQAAQMIMSGRNLEITVPCEGTLSFRMGMLSNCEIPPVSDELLIRSGMRLTDGRCMSGIYPAGESYNRASFVNDYGHFTKVTERCVRQIRRHAAHTRYLSTADSSEALMFPVIVLLITFVWMAGALYRITRPDIRRAVFAVCMMIALWLTLRIIKYKLFYLSDLNRICWYGFYIFFMGLPLVLLYIAIIIDKPYPRSRIPVEIIPFAVIYAAFIVMVFTNDWHNMVFSFDLSENWSDNYTYGIGYFLIFAFCIIMFLASLFLLIRKSHKSPKKNAVLAPVLAAVLMISYNIGYIAGIPILRDSDITFIFCTFSVLFMETVIFAGLIPSSTHYRDIFEYSPLNMQILDNNGKAVLSSPYAQKLNRHDTDAILSEPGVSIHKGEDTLIRSQKINGGITVWQEDISTLNELHRQIGNSVEKMRSANILLSRDSEIRKRKMAVEIKTELFDSLEKDIRDKTDELSRLVKTLPDSEERDKQVAYITLLLCHIKRRCNLFFLSQENDCISGNELAVYLDELSEFASYSGVNALVRCGSMESLNLRTASICYDFYFSLLSWSVKNSHATIIGQLENRKSGLCFDILTSENTETVAFSKAFTDAADAAGAGISFRSLGDTAGIYLLFPADEIKNGGEEN